jgi:hypothetical protein
MTAEELWGNHFNGLHWDDITQEKEIEFAKEYARLKCQELLEIVAEKVALEHFTPFSGWQRNSYIEDNTRVDKDSIFNVVNLDELIK